MKVALDASATRFGYLAPFTKRRDSNLKMHTTEDQPLFRPFDIPYSTLTHAAGITSPRSIHYSSISQLHVYYQAKFVTIPKDRQWHFTFSSEQLDAYCQRYGIHPQHVYRPSLGTRDIPLRSFLRDCPLYSPYPATLAVLHSRSSTRSAP